MYIYLIFVIFVNLLLSLDSEISGCPDPRDLSHCLFEAIYNDGCQTPEEMKIICREFCSRPC